MGYFDFETSKIYDFFIKKEKEKINSNAKDVNNLKKTINNVIDKINLPDSKKFLIVGRIQSGKTNFAIGLNAKLIDDFTNNKNIFIHLTSSNKKIMDQNYLRFDNFFNSKEIDKSQIFILKKTKTFLDEFSLAFENNNDFLLFFMKEPDSLKKIKELIDFLTSSNEKVNIFIIDDEGDNASFNTYDNTEEFNEEESRIYAFISEIVNSKCQNFNFIKYISITATPMIHLLAHNNNPLKPDYAFLLDKKLGYTGIDEYMDEVNKIKSTLFHSMPKIVSSYDEDKLLLCAILFFCKSLFVEKKDIEVDGTPIMLVIISNKMKEQNTCRGWLRESIDKLFSDVDLLEWKIKDWKIIDYLNDEIKKIIQLENITEADIAKNIIQHFKNKYRIIAFNSQNSSEDEELENFENDKCKYLRIVIGKNRLSRGVTFRNLINVFVSYLPTGDKNIDNVLQQCRWFGYREKYLKHISMFMNEEFREIYDNILEAQQDFYLRLQICEEKGQKFSEMEKYFSLLSKTSSNLLATYNRRAKQKYIKEALIVPSLRAIKNKYSSYHRKEQDKFVSVYENFSKKWTKDKFIDENNYPFIEFDSFTSFTSFLNESGYELNDIFGDNFSNIEKVIKLLNQKTILRFVNNKFNEIEWRERIITNLNGYVYFWGNGRYKDEEKGLNQDKINYIDILPLHIYSKEHDFDEKLFRLKLNINQAIISSIEMVNEEEKIIRKIVPKNNFKNVD